MNVSGSDLPPGSVQNDAQKWWNLWKSLKIVENPRWVAYKNRWKITFWRRPGNVLQKKRDFYVRIACGHVQVTLCSKHPIFIDFHLKIARIHMKSRKWTVFEAICFLRAFITMRKNDEICDNPWNRRKSSMTTRQKSTRNQILSTSRWHFAKKRDFHVRNASAHIKIKLCSKRRNSLDFHLKLLGSIPNP